jgi:subtilisin family serine protease
VAASNGGGILGTAPDAKLVFLKIQSAATCGEEILNGDVIAAIDWVITNQERYGIKMISMSFGRDAFSSVCDSVSPLRQAVNAAHDAGLIVFAAAGNEAQTDAISNPACLSNAISVGAVYDDSLGAANFRTCTDVATHADLVTCYSNSAGILAFWPPHTAPTQPGPAVAQRTALAAPRRQRRLLPVWPPPCWKP